MAYRYSYDTSKKYICPKCGEHYKYSRYIDNTTSMLIDEKYGRCERVNSCGYDEKPPQGFISDSENQNKRKPQSLYDSDVLDDTMENYRDFTKRNAFFYGLYKAFGFDKTVQAIDLYNLGTFYDDAVIFPYYFLNDLKTAKIMWYNDDLHRNKEKGFKWLHNGSYTAVNGNRYQWLKDEFKLGLPLFGWDLIKQDKTKTICCVEAEKTAVIMSIVFPQFTWVAAGSLGYLNKFKFIANQERNWLFFPDMGILKSKNISVTEYWKAQVTKISESYTFGTCEFIDYIPPTIPKYILKEFNDEGKDIADFMLCYIGCENTKALSDDNLNPKDKLKQRWAIYSYELIFKDLNYLNYMTELLSPYI